MAEEVKPYYDAVTGFIDTLRDSAPELMVRVFTEGSCYKLYRILNYVFDGTVAYYNSDHVITYVYNTGKFYDINGVVSPEEAAKYIPLTDYGAAHYEAVTNCRFEPKFLAA